jgi:hypothetical protein
MNGPMCPLERTLKPWVPGTDSSFPTSFMGLCPQQIDLFMAGKPSLPDSRFFRLALCSGCGPLASELDWPGAAFAFPRAFSCVLGTGSRSSTRPLGRGLRVRFVVLLPNAGEARAPDRGAIPGPSPSPGRGPVGVPRAEPCVYTEQTPLKRAERTDREPATDPVDLHGLGYDWRASKLYSGYAFLAPWSSSRRTACNARHSWLESLFVACSLLVRDLLVG